MSKEMTQKGLAKENQLFCPTFVAHSSYKFALLSSNVQQLINESKNSYSNDQYMLRSEANEIV
jgi:hypothetical protein